MIGKKDFQPRLLYNVSLEDLVPEDNFYRTLERIPDLNFVYKECEGLYGKTGNKSIDPVVFFKLNLFGYFEDIIYDRELIKRASDSLAVRLYLGYDLDEQLPWHSTISRTRAIMPEKIFSGIFNKVLRMCAEAGLIEGSHQSIDSTLVKANASLETIERKTPKLTLEKYIEELKKENQEEVFPEQIEKISEPNKDKKTDQSTELKVIKPGKNKRVSLSNKNYKSITDPDSRIAKKPGKLINLYYTVHYAVDSQAKIITDVLSTHADKSDSSTLLEIVDRTEKRLNELGLKIESVGADKNYCSGENLQNLEQKEIEAYIPTQNHPNTRGGIEKKKFIYDEAKDVYVCPMGHQLKYKYITKRKGKVYCVENKECLSCSLKEKCSPGKKLRRLQHSVFIKEYERLSERMSSSKGKQKMRIRKTTTEPLFAKAKMNHGLSKFMTRGIDKSQKKAFCIATVQNLKRLVKHLSRKANVLQDVSIKLNSYFQKQLSHFKEKSNYIFPRNFFSINYNV